MGANHKMGKLEKIEEFLRELDDFEVDLDVYRTVKEVSAFIAGMEFAVKKAIEILQDNKNYQNDIK